MPDSLAGGPRALQLPGQSRRQPTGTKFDRSHYMTDAQIDAWVAETRHKVMYRDAENVD